MATNSNSIKDFSPPLGLMGIIFILSSIPGKIDNENLKFLTELDPNLQNLLHIPLYGLLQILWLRSFHKRGKIDRRAALACMAISMAYGVLDEGHQYFVPGRTASVTDMGLNVAGVVLGTLGYALATRPKKNAHGT